MCYLLIKWFGWLNIVLGVVGALVSLTFWWIWYWVPFTFEEQLLALVFMLGSALLAFICFTIAHVCRVVREIGMV